MARKNQHTFSKRQREKKKADKAAQKRVRRAERTDPSESPPAFTEDQPPVEENDEATPV
jgi:hypothetical protein